MTARFTGWHMLTIMVGFFGLVMAVNILMARYAIATFGGEVVQNSYVASQRFDGWLARARAQDKLGWHAVPSVDSAGWLHVRLTDGAGNAFPALVTVVARHPLGSTPDRRIVLRAQGADHVADAPLPGGRWLLHITVRAGGHQAHYEDEVRA